MSLLETVFYHGYKPAYSRGSESNHLRYPGELPRPPPHHHHHHHHPEKSSDSTLFASPLPVTSAPPSGVQSSEARSPHTYFRRDIYTKHSPPPHPCSETKRPTRDLEEDGRLASDGCYPEHFNSGSLIQLSNGDIKRVEDLEADDFVKSAKKNHDVQIEQSIVLSVSPKTDTSTAMVRFSVGRQKVHVSSHKT